jgi:hypothetical protein
MAEVTQLLAKLRGEAPPERPYHPAIARREERRRQRLADETDETGESGTSGGASAP